MIVTELRESAHARRFLLQGMTLQRVIDRQPEEVETLIWLALQVTARGDPLPPLGFLGDVAHVALETGAIPSAASHLRAARGLPATLIREYEDHVIGRFYTDVSFERATDALLRYPEAERPAAFAFLIDAIRQRADVGGVELSPAVLRAMLSESGESLLLEGAHALEDHGPTDELVQLYEALVQGIRGLGSLVGPEDLFELERGTALMVFGHRLALRQVLSAVACMEALVPRNRALRPVSARQVATARMEEDAYPTGGFSNLSTRGTIESLLQSQLAFIDDDESPDLFDIKYVRDELYYYARDENLFFRRRRTIVLALHPSLNDARVKDPGAPWQRIILLLASLVVLVGRLREALADEALRVEVVLPDAADGPTLADERGLLELLLADGLCAGTVVFSRLAADRLVAECEQWGRQSLCQCLWLGHEGQAPQVDVELAWIALSPGGPLWEVQGEQAVAHDGADAVEAWAAFVDELLSAWL